MLGAGRRAIPRWATEGQRTQRARQSIPAHARAPSGDLLYPGTHLITEHVLLHEGDLAPCQASSSFVLAKSRRAGGDSGHVLGAQRLPSTGVAMWSPSPLGAGLTLVLGKGPLMCVLGPQDHLRPPGS